MATSLSGYRRNTGREMGGFANGTATGGTTTTLADTSYKLKSSILSENTYKDWWLFRGEAASTADRARRVANYAPSTGTITVDLAYVNAPTNGENYELYALVEPFIDLTIFVNDGLRQCFTEFEFTLTPTANVTRHTLSSVSSWLAEPGWIRQVGYLASGEDREKVDPYRRVVRGRVLQDGATFYLEHPYQTFNSTDTIYVKAIQPAYYQCRASGGTFGDQSGLNLETDECNADFHWVTAATLVEAWRRIGTVLDPLANQGLIKNREEAAIWFTSLTRSNFRLPELTFRPHRGWFGPLPGPGNLY